MLTFMSAECKCAYTLNASALISWVSKLTYMELKDRALEARLAAGFKTVPPFAAAIGIKPAAVYMIESGATRSLKSNTLAAYAALSGLNAEWIRTGRDPKRAPSTQAAPAHAQPAQAEDMASGQPAPPGWVTRSDNHARLWRALDDAAGALSPAAAGALATLIGEAAARRAAPEAQAHLAEAIRVVREGLAGQPPWAPERLLDVINGVAEALAEGGVARHRPVAELIEFAARRRA